MIKSAFLSSVFILLSVSVSAQTADDASSNEETDTSASEEAAPESPARLYTSAPITTLIPVDSVTAWGLVEENGTIDVFRCNGDLGTCSFLDWTEIED